MFNFCCISYPIGVISVDGLREKIDLAIRDNDKERLEDAINECISVGRPELDARIHRAREVLKSLEENKSLESKSPDSFRRRLKRATKQKDRYALEKLIVELEAAEFPELGSDLRKARNTLKSLGGGLGG
uniref:Uncharacterized protein n=1 Tax=Octopus bimaculoides TaxID=37653 RepID=A0A0L8FP52_OCTBM